jgi:hypothetical protein
MAKRNRYRKYLWPVYVGGMKMDAITSKMAEKTEEVIWQAAEKIVALKDEAEAQIERAEILVSGLENI